MRLLLLRCPTCATPLEANHQDQVVACSGCATHVALGEDGPLPITVHYAQPVGDPLAVGSWEPLWIFSGQVTLRSRQTQGGKKAGREADEFWQAPRRFYVPAGDLSPAQIRSIGLDLLNRQPSPIPLPAGPQTGRMRPALLSAADAAQFAEFLVLDLEAQRRDMLKDLQFDLLLGEPALWAAADFRTLGQTDARSQNRRGRLAAAPGDAVGHVRPSRKACRPLPADFML